MDLGEDTTKWQSVVARERVAHPATCRHKRRAREEHTDERKHQKTDTTGRVLRRVHEDLQKRAGTRLNNTVDVVHAEEHAAQENKTRTHADSDAVEHDTRASHLRLRDFLDHMGDRVEASECKRALQQAEHPCETVWPLDLVYELPVHERARLVIRRGARQDGDANDGESGQAPEEGRFRKQRKQPGRKGVDEQRDERKRDIDQELVPRLGLVVRMQ